MVATKAAMMVVLMAFVTAEMTVVRSARTTAERLAAM